MFSRASFGAFEMWTCAGCGFSELYATNFQNLDVASSQGRIRWFDASAPQGPGYRWGRMSRFMSLIYDRFMRASERACLEQWRSDLLAGLSGSVLEIGAGTGANVSRYPDAVTRLVLLDDDRHMLARLEARLREGESSVRDRIEIREASATSLPFPDRSFDAVVSTLVLCSVPEVDSVLAEVKRVLRPGGAFVYLEHVADEEGTSRFAWQRRLEPVWRRLAGNCHLTRRTGDAIRRAGFVVDDERRESMRKALPIVRPTVRGIAHA